MPSASKMLEAFLKNKQMIWNGRGLDGNEDLIDIETSEKKIHKFGDNKFPGEWEMF